MEKTKYVLGFMFDRYYDRVVLIRKIKPIYHFGLWNGVGGHIEPGEMSVDAMAREFKEETGEETSTANWKNMGYLQSPEWIVDLYKYIDDKKHIATINIMTKFPTDEAVAVWETRNLPVHIVPNLRWLIPAIVEKEFDTFYIQKF